MLVIACETNQPPAFPAFVDDASPASRQGTLNSQKPKYCHTVLESASTVSDVSSNALRTVAHVNKIAVLFGERSTKLTKKGSCQGLSDDKPIGLALAPLEVCAP